MMENIIEINDLTKSYGNKTVLKGLAFTVEKGETFALLGVNGAGKTTTLECLEGLRSYDAGTITINGKMGIQLQSSSLPENIKPMEALNLFSKWNANWDNRLSCQTLGLDAFEKKQYRELSTGQKRRLHLAIALIGNPDIIVLDEPTAGLDVEGQVELHEIIRELKQQGKTILMSSHDMTEVENLCDRVAILKEGKIEFIGHLAELTQNELNTIQVTIKSQKPLSQNNFKNCRCFEHDQEQARFEMTNLNAGLMEIIDHYNNEAITILDLVIHKNTLEERFMQIAREEKR